MATEETTPGQKKVTSQPTTMKPATTPPSTTEPQDLHIPEQEQPPMPEEADTPEQPIGSDAVAGAGDPVKQEQPEGDPPTKQPPQTAPSRTDPEDLKIPEELPPPMPDIADKPDTPPQKLSL